MQVDLNAPSPASRMATYEQLMNLYGGKNAFEERDSLDISPAPKIKGVLPNGKAFLIIKTAHELEDADKSAITLCERSRAFIWLAGYSGNKEQSCLIIGETDPTKQFVQAVEKIMRAGNLVWTMRSTLWCGISYEELLPT